MQLKLMADLLSLPSFYPFCTFFLPQLWETTIPTKNTELFHFTLTSTNTFMLPINLVSVSFDTT